MIYLCKINLLFSHNIYIRYNNDYLRKKKLIESFK